MPRTIDFDIVKATFKACDDSAWPQRDRLLIGLASTCGLRLSEIVSLKTSSVSLGDKAGLQVVGKGDKERWVPLTKNMVSVYSNYIDSRAEKLAKFGVEDPQWLFIKTRRPANPVPGNLRLAADGAGYIFKTLLRKVGVDEPGMRVHGYRHSYATLGLQSGALNVRELQEILGHSSLATIQVYTHVAQDDLIQAVENHPLAELG